MLLIIMQNNREYLNAVSVLAMEQGIKDVTIVKKNGVGSFFKNTGSDFILKRPDRIDNYERALVAVVDGEDKATKFLDTIEHDSHLNIMNLNDKSMICKLPFNYFEFLGINRVNNGIRQ